MNTITEWILEQDGDFTLHPDQCLHLRHRAGSRTTVGSRINAGILGEQHPELNSSFVLFRDVTSLTGNLISWQSTGCVDRYTWRTPHFLMHSRCTACSFVCAQSYQAHAWLKIGVHLCVPKKTFTLHPLRAMSHTLQHYTMHGHSFSAFSSPSITKKHCHKPRPLQRGTSTELPPLTGSPCGSLMQQKQH